MPGWRRCWLVRVNPLRSTALNENDEKEWLLEKRNGSYFGIKSVHSAFGRTRRGRWGWRCHCSICCVRPTFLEWCVSISGMLSCTTWENMPLCRILALSFFPSISLFTSFFFLFYYFLFLPFFFFFSFLKRFEMRTLLKYWRTSEGLRCIPNAFNFYRKLEIWKFFLQKIIIF